MIGGALSRCQTAQDRRDVPRKYIRRLDSRRQQEPRSTGWTTNFDTPPLPFQSSSEAANAPTRRGVRVAMNLPHDQRLYSQRDQPAPATVSSRDRRAARRDSSRLTAGTPQAREPPLGRPRVVTHLRARIRRTIQKRLGHKDKSATRIYGTCSTTAAVA